MTGICPFCGSDDIRVGQVLKTIQKDKEYHVLHRCLCKGCGQPIIGVKTYRAEEEMTYIKKEDMKVIYGTSHGKFFGKWA